MNPRYFCPDELTNIVLLNSVNEEKYSCGAERSEAEQRYYVVVENSLINIFIYKWHITNTKVCVTIITRQESSNYLTQIMRSESLVRNSTMTQGNDQTKMLVTR
jgi:hypothetical protein